MTNRDRPERQTGSTGPSDNDAFYPERIAGPSESETEELTLLWEAAVRATHEFLHEADFGPLRREVRGALHSLPIYTVREKGRFVAFMGVSGEKIEMLFVRPDRFGQRLGKQFVNYAIERLGVKYVDVNEQNAGASAFYRKCGFGIVGREAVDSAGRPYPILHLRRRQRKDGGETD